MRWMFLFLVLVLLACRLQAENVRSAVRERVREQLADDFAALNRGRLTLSELGWRVVRRAEQADETEQKLLWSGAMRIFARAHETNGLAQARKGLDALRNPFVIHGREAVLRLGKFGELEFVHCPTGTVDVVLDWKGTNSVRVALTHQFWMMKYPLTRQQSAYYPPLDPTPKVLDKKIWSAYVNANRAMAEGLTRHFTARLASKLPKGYVIRLPTLAEWEYAFHADATEPDLFADLRHIHHNDAQGRRLYYDYDADEPRRQKRHNAWGLGDWCPQEKVLDTFDARELVRGFSDDPDFFQVTHLPMPSTRVNPVSVCTNEYSAALIRMPSWARWKAAMRGFGQDWCPLRLVIAPKID